MCGIMGFYDKTGQRRAALGDTMLKMLSALGRRGPDSSGIALYNSRPDSTQVLRVKLGDAAGTRYEDRAADVARRVAEVAAILDEDHNGEYLRLAVGYEGDPRELQARAESVHPEVEVISFGSALDIVKQVGSPQNLDARFGIGRAAGSHAIAHTRLSTESRIDLSHSQPFWAHGCADVASAHNGHITNYHKLRRQYEQRGVRFYTENDSEVIGVFLAEVLGSGGSLADALQESVRFLDGSFSVLAASQDEIGFAKDSFGLKPLIVAEDGKQVAIATEEIALRAAVGNGIETWEPPPGTVRVWRVE